jgi:hypothetical protein
MAMVAKRIRFYYGIFLSVLTAVLGALFIAQAVTILADGDWVQGAYSREIVAEHLFPVSIVLYVWIAAIVAGFVLSLIFPYNEKQVKTYRGRETLHRLSSRIPEGSGEEYEADLKKVREEKLSRLIIYTMCAAICFIGVIVSAVYLFRSDNFTSPDKNMSMLYMLLNVGPWVLVIFGTCIFMASFEQHSIDREITALKHLIASNKGNPVIVANTQKNAVLLKIQAFFGNKYFKLGVRIAVGAVAVALVLVGIFCTEGARDVFIKAINICTECIGLG